MGRPICISPCVRCGARRGLAISAARRSDPRGSEGVRLPASARAPARSADSASDRRRVDARGPLNARPRRVDALGARRARPALFRRGGVVGTDDQRPSALEPLDPARTRARCRLALPGPRGALRARDRSGRLGKAPPLADVHLDDRFPETSCLGGCRLDRDRRDVRLVGGHRLCRIGSYPDLVRRLSEIQAENSYSLVGMAATADCLPPWGRRSPRVGGALLVACVVFARRADDRRSFTCAVAATLALSPIVWLHYLVVLLVPLAIARPRFSLIWLLPVLLWVSPKPGYAEGSDVRSGGGGGHPARRPARPADQSRSRERGTWPREITTDVVRSANASSRGAVADRASWRRSRFSACCPCS